eukprot:TRINITY_DN2453_c0_g1_i1.p1 TRINITY_DN2453_c0_g1~~TRINITY_DN2453_c0_g1_i1.p1  ORF type:complete len:415 (+),score=144.48 TRINITY_DN2453_c0_g1_i1:51-1247(+)
MLARSLAALRPAAASAASARSLASRAFASAAPLDHTKLQIERTTKPGQKLPKEELVFGRTFTDHMLTVEWTQEGGWGAPHIRPYGNLSLSPASNCLHYGIECFEGMKAYKDAQQQIRLFRPADNMERLNLSAQRLQLPGFDGDEYLECMKALIHLDHEWIPASKGYSLYIRPTMIGTQPSLGVGPSFHALLYTILSPVGPYYPTGFKPVSLYADTEHVRAWPGGTGDRKVGGNYGPSILPQVNAAKKGYSQVLWLYGDDHRITEVGTMNCFVLWDNAASGERELVTAPLDGTILPGVTRRSIIELAHHWGVKVVERALPMGELIDALAAGRLHEVFGAGTAAIVSPVNKIGYKGQDYEIPLDKQNPDAAAGPFTNKLMDEILAIQYGEKEFKGWSVPI